MNYNAELFFTNKVASPDTKYKYELSGAFYHVFSNGDNDYHMAGEDRASLLERIRFFNLYLSRNKYPIYSRKYGLIKDSTITNDIFSQVLGLPYDLLVKKEGKGDSFRILTSDEIINRITFEDGLSRQYYLSEKLNANILYSNNSAVVGAINYLIEHGFYVLNPERIFDLNQTDESNYYPFYIDVEKIPAQYLYEKENSDKLMMDFVSDPLIVSKNDFVSYFKKIDSLTLEEQCELAFGRKSLVSEETPSYQQFKLALKRYFLSIVRSLLNEFFMEKFHERNLFGASVLNHDFEGTCFTSRMVYQGCHYDMYALSYRDFGIVDYEVVQSYRPKNYVLDRADKAKLIHSYQAVKKYFKSHPTYGYVPSIFLRIMGLPYPAFEKLKYFDFENGDADHFVAKLSFKQHIAYEHDGLLLTMMTGNGMQESYHNWKTTLPFYFKKLEKRGLFISDLYAFCSSLMPNTILSYRDQGNDKLNQLLDGKYSLYHQTIEIMEEKTNEIVCDNSQLESLKHFVSRDEYDGKLTTIHNFFSFMLQGYDAETAFSLLGDTHGLDDVSLRIFIGMTLICVFEKSSQSSINRIINSSKSAEKLLERANCGEQFYDQFHDYPNIYKGRNFIAYRKDNENIIYLDSKDRPAIFNLIEIFYRYQISGEDLSFMIPVFGRELVYSYTGSNLLEFLGLPKILWDGINLYDVLGSLHFKDNISIFEKGNHYHLIQKDYSLHYLYFFSLAASDGIYLLGRLAKEVAPFYCLSECIPDSVKKYISLDFIRIQMAGEQYNDLDKDLFSSLVDMNDSLFEKEFISVLLGLRTNYSNYLDHRYAYRYAGKIAHAYYQSRYYAFFHTQPHHYLLSYAVNDKMEVALGNNFNAYSFDRGESFYFPSVDEKGMQFALSRLLIQFNKVKNKKKLARLITYHMGLPAIAEETFYYHLLENDFHLSLDWYSSMDVEERNLYSYKDIFSMESTSFLSLFDSTQIHHYASTQGMFILPFTRVLVPELLNPKKMIENINDTRDLIVVSLLSVSEDCQGIVKEILKPSEPAFVYYVKDFIQTYHEQAHLSSSFLFYCQELFMYLYSEDSSFLIKCINLLQNESSLEYEKYFKKAVTSFSLKNYHMCFGKEEVSDLFTLFLIYLEQQILYRISKKLR